MSTDRAKQAIDLVQHCTDMLDVRRTVDALDDVLVPLLVTRIGYMQQAARIQGDVGQVRDEARIEAIVSRVRERTVQVLHHVLAVIALPRDCQIVVKARYSLLNGARHKTCIKGIQQKVDFEILIRHRLRHQTANRSVFAIDKAGQPDDLADLGVRQVGFHTHGHATDHALIRLGFQHFIKNPHGLIATQ